MSSVCLNKAFQILARRDHSSAELARKLQTHGFTKKETEETIKSCIHLGYLNDERFADVYLHQLQRKGKGIHKIKQQLYAKGIPKEIICHCVASYCTDDVQLAACRSALEKKLNVLNGDHNRDDARLKLMRFLAGRGFSTHIIHQAIEEAWNRKEG